MRRLPYTSAVGSRRAWGLVMLGLVGGCVNTYVVDEATTANDASGTVADTDPSRDDATSSASNAMGDTAAATGGGTDDTTSADSGSNDVAGDTTSAGGAELCQPCTSDAECGAAVDLCYAFTESQLACLRRCGEGCGDGFQCQSVMSVDGVTDDQCVPTSGTCAQ